MKARFKKIILVLAVAALASIYGFGQGHRGVTGYAQIHVEPTNWHGSCPHRFEFVATIHSRGAGVVHYHWERSDGTSTPIQSHAFSGPNQAYEIVNEWSLRRPRGDHFRGWEALRVTEPNMIRTPNAVFNMTCTD